MAHKSHDLSPQFQQQSSARRGVVRYDTAVSPPTPEILKVSRDTSQLDKRPDTESDMTHSLVLTKNGSKNSFKRFSQIEHG